MSWVVNAKSETVDNRNFGTTIHGIALGCGVYFRTFGPEGSQSVYIHPDAARELANGILAVFPNPAPEAPKPDPVGDVTGVQVYVTGDSDDWCHGIAPGTLVEIVEDDDVTRDGSYFVKIPGRSDSSGSWYVGANDLSIDPPIVTFGPGTVVRSKLSGIIYTITEDGFYCHSLGMHFNRDRALRNFTSEHYDALTP